MQERNLLINIQIKEIQSKPRKYKKYLFYKRICLKKYLKKTKNNNKIIKSIKIT